MTNVQKEHARFTVLWEEHNENLKRLIAEEFPLGRKVRWQHGDHWIDGTVERHSSWGGGDVHVKNKKTGNMKRIDAKHLELVDG